LAGLDASKRTVFRVDRWVDCWAKRRGDPWSYRWIKSRWFSRNLRLTLRRSGYTPRKFVKFLDHCSKLILLKKVGGGYIFIHRMLLEYFADLTPESIRAGDAAMSSK
jgi:hypothetical protein